MKDEVHSWKLLRCHADHREVGAADAHVSSNDRRVAGELLAPGVVCEDDHRVASRHAILVGNEGAADPRRHAEHIEEVAADHEAEPGLRRVVRAIGETRDGHTIGDEPREAVRPIPQVDVVAVRRQTSDGDERVTLLRDRCRDRDDVAALRDLQRPQCKRVGETEHRRIQADADRDRHHRDGREAWVLQQHPHAVPEVVPYAFEHWRHLSNNSQVPASKSQTSGSPSNRTRSWE
jgi:hypothetical protein